MTRFAVAALLLAACSPPEDAGKTKTILGAAWIEPGGAIVEPSAIVTGGTRILRAGTQAETPIPAGSLKTPAWGKFVIAAPAKDAESACRAGGAWLNGSLKPGAAADLWILDANPAKDCAALARPARIMRAGEWTP